MEEPEGKRGRRLFFAALGFFIVAKVLFILLPIEGLGMPRNGDDSFYILWGGRQLQQGYDLSTPALSDIRMQFELQDNPSKAQEWHRSRALFRSVGTHSPFFDLVTAAVLTLGMPAKWSYAVLEIFVALVMGTGIAVFLRQLFGGPAAAMGLLLLSFVALPLRGLHYFAASPLVLCIALILWAYMLRHGMKSDLRVLLPGWLIALGTHPLGLVYLCSGLAMLFLAEGQPRDWIRPRAIVIAGALMALAAGYQILSMALPFLGMESAFAGRGLHFGDGVLENLAETVGFMKEMAAGGGAFIVLSAIACFTAARRRVLTRQVGAAVAAVCLPLMLSLFYVYPGYPGVVFGRLLVSLMIILAGAAGAFLAQFFVGGHGRLTRCAVGGATAILVALTAVPCYRLMIQNLNARPEIINEKALSAQIARLPDKTTILYLNPDFTVNAAFLAGGDRLGALVGTMLVHSNSKMVSDLISGRRPTVVAITLPDFLNFYAFKGLGALGERRYGVPFELAEKILLGPAQANRPLKEVHAWVTNNADTDLDLVVHENPQSPDPPPDAGRRIKVPRGYSGWMRLDGWLKLDDGKNVRQLLVTLPASKGWIEGVSFTPPMADVRWPWTSQTRWAVLIRGDAKKTFREMRLSIPRLFADKSDRPFLPLIRHRNPILSDDTGIVFLNTVFAPP